MRTYRSETDLDGLNISTNELIDLSTLTLNSATYEVFSSQVRGSEQLLSDLR